MVIPNNKTRRRSSTLLLTLNYLFLFVGSIGSSILSRFYFLHSGSSRWLSTVVQSLGFPFLLPLLILSKKPYFSRTLTLKLSSLSLLLGLFLGLNNFLFSWGISYLPVSTASLLLSSQLAFNLVFSVLIVRHPVTVTNLNTVVLLSLSSFLIAVNSSHDRPKGVTQPQFLLGLATTLGAALLFASYLPVMQVVLRAVHTYRDVVEVQVLMEVSATAFAVAGMAVGGGFKEVVKDVGVFDLGVGAYWATVAATVVCWQMCFMATAGSVFLTSSLTSGICMTALLVANVVAGVVVFGDSLGGVKAVAAAMCVWGFSTYLYGEYVARRAEAEEVVENNGGSGSEQRLILVGRVKSYRACLVV